MNTENQVKDPKQGYFKVIKNEIAGTDSWNYPYKKYNKMYDNSDVVKLIFQNNEYHIAHGDNLVIRQTISKIKDESDEDYLERAIKLFDDYCNAQQDFKKRLTPEVIKSRRIGW